MSLNHETYRMQQPQPRSSRRSPRRLRALSLVAGLAVIAAACTSDDGTIAQTGTTVESEPASAIDFASASGIRGGDPEFNLSALVWQGYWLSRDHFGPFVMASGMGIPFEPPAEMMQAAMAMVAQNPNDPVQVPQNLAPLQAVFASGDPTLVNDPREFDPLDFEGLRLDPSTFDQTVRVRAEAETMLKESQWAHNFADPHFGTPDGEFGAQQRFIGQMVSLLATMQGSYAMANLAGPDGLYVDSDGTVDPIGNWVLLHAFADIAALTSGDAADGRYTNPDAASSFAAATEGLFSALAARTPGSADEAAAAIRALVYVAATNDDLAGPALGRVSEIADDLAASDPTGPVESAATIAGLVSAAAAADGDTELLARADDVFATMHDDFDHETGVFTTTGTYTVDDVAWIIGGLNSLVQQGSEASRPDAARMLLAYYEATISLGGMQLSAPPGNDGAMAGEWEKDLPNVNYYHPRDTPPPPVARALPIPAEEITWDGTAWSVTSRRFVVAGAMHLANELNWLGPHLGSVPFPLSDTATVPAPDAAATPASSEIEIHAENIAFDTDRIEIRAGQEVTFVFHNDDDGVQHNFHIQAGAVDVKTDITPGPDTNELVVQIDEPGTYRFVCDVHPNMTGELVVT